MRIQLPTGNTITVSDYEWLFILKEEDVAEFYQSCIADDLGSYIDNPWSSKIVFGRIEIDEDDENNE